MRLPSPWHRSRRPAAAAPQHATGAGDHRPFAYQPALDGLRALAVAAVLAYHAGLPWARGGFLGVDAFFVLSGYLISGLLLAEWRATGSIDLGAFWARRARRLLPALFLLLAGVALYAAVLAEPEELARVRADALASLAYVANWRPVVAGESYFAQFATPSPLVHTWSLAVEEQWYLVWPLLAGVILYARRGSPVAFAGAALALAAASALLMGWLYDPRGDPSRVYYGTDTRAQSLLVGAALAGLLAWRGRGAPGRTGAAVLQCVGLACAVVIAWMWMTTDYASPRLYQGGFLLLAAAVAVVITAATTAGGLLARILSAWPLRALGLISYGVYLWHWPVYLVLTPDRTGRDGYELFAVRVAVTLAIAAASYHVVETPFRRRRFAVGRTAWILAPASAALLVVALVAVTRTGREPAMIASTAPPPPPAGAAAPVRVLVVGDSVAFTMAQGLGRPDAPWNLRVWNQGKIGCGVLRGDAVLIDGRWTGQDEGCNDWAVRWRSYVDLFQPHIVLVLAGAWDLYDRRVDGRVLPFGTPQADAFALSELQEAADVLSSGGAKVLFLTTPRYRQRDLGLAAQAPRFDAARIARLNRLYATLSAQRPDTVQVMDLSGFVDATQEQGRSGGALFSDGVHFTTAGADRVAEWLAPAIEQAARNRTGIASALAEPPPAGMRSPSRWLELLEHVPDTPETRASTVMNDYVRYREASGVALPDDAEDPQALFAYYRRLLFDAQGGRTGLFPASITGAPEFPPRLTETQAELGFTIAGVHQDVSSGDPALRILRGDFDAIGRRPYGGGLVEVGDGYLYASATATGLDAMLGTSVGATPSLAGVGSFALLAHGLDRLETYTALFSDDAKAYTAAEVARRVAGTDASAEAVEEARAALERTAMLLPYEAFATGEGMDAAGPYTAVVLVQPDEVSARTNAARLRDRVAHARSWLAGRPFAELVDAVEVETDGRLVLAKLRGDAHGLWFALHAARDTLLLHE